MRHPRSVAGYVLAVAFAIVAFGVPWIMSNPSVGQYVATVILAHKPKTVEQLKTPNQKIKILLVPGHEPDYGGTEFGAGASRLYERNLTVELANDLRTVLQGNPRYEVYVTRDTTDWAPNFSSYFKTEWNDILTWQKARIAETKDLRRIGQMKKAVPTVYHNKAPTGVATRLFGINKWANENDVDVVLHIHFNDYPGRPDDGSGVYSGFTIYVPESQYYNGTTTRSIANTVFKRLSEYNPVSNLRGEDAGIVEDQDLIAIGSYNSVDAASMLIEYAYIYEPSLRDPMRRSIVMKDWAFQTYQGLEDFFNDGSITDMAYPYGTVLLPHAWNELISEKSTDINGIFALQTALIRDGSYPPRGETLNSCPRTGKFGGCTKEAVSAFQKKYNIEGEQGVAGQKTLEKLNGLYGLRAI